MLRLNCSSSEISNSSLENLLTGGKRSWQRSAAYKAAPNHLRGVCGGSKLAAGHEMAKHTRSLKYRIPALPTTHA
jgi:hypothetical protein